jgi:hypothetical protein
MPLSETEQQELLNLLKKTQEHAEKAMAGWNDSMEKCSQFRLATVSAAETAKLAIERLQKQEAIIEAALAWREQNPKRQFELGELATAVDSYNKYLKERS